MKVVVLAGGFGTRISEESRIRPKPLVEVGGRPILWHIMKIYSHYGLDDFVICCGYKGQMIKQYFRDLMELSGEVTYDFKRDIATFTRTETKSWRVTLVDTGPNSMTGGRIGRVRHLLQDPFCMTYGDGVGDIPIDKLIESHRQSGLQATVTAVRQPGRFGALQIDRDTGRVAGFREKAPEDGGLINGGFFVLEPSVLDLIDGDETVWEQEPMRKLVDTGQLHVFPHHGFWQNLDTLRDREVLEEYWKSGDPPWRVWSEDGDSDASV